MPQQTCKSEFAVCIECNGTKRQ